MFSPLILTFTLSGSLQGPEMRFYSSLYCALKELRKCLVHCWHVKYYLPKTCYKLTTFSYGIFKKCQDNCLIKWSVTISNTFFAESIMSYDPTRVRGRDMDKEIKPLVPPGPVGPEAAGPRLHCASIQTRVHVCSKSR